MKSVILMVLSVIFITAGILLCRKSGDALKAINFRNMRRIPYKRNDKKTDAAQKYSAMLIQRLNTDTDSKTLSGIFGYRRIEEESTLALARKRVKR